MVTDFSAEEKDKGVKLRMLLRLLSGQVFSHFGELWLTWCRGGGTTSGMSYTNHSGAVELSAVARWAVEIGNGAIA